MDNALSVADCAEHSDISDEPETSITRHYQRLQRAEDAWSKLRQPALTTTFQKEGSFFTSNRCHFCDSEAGQVLAVAWTAVQQQDFANLAPFQCTLK